MRNYFGVNNNNENLICEKSHENENVFSKKLILNPIDLKNFVLENLKFSKKLLNDFESMKEIENYLNDFDNDNYNENENNISFEKIIYKKDKFTNEIDFFIEYEIIKRKYIFFDFFIKIESILFEIVEILQKNITFKKHLIILENIKQFLLSDFLTNILYNYFNHFDNNDLNNEYLIKNLSNFEYTIKNIYKIVRFSYMKILNQILNIIENNIIDL